jgi:hypothetical protein
METHKPQYNLTIEGVLEEDKRVREEVRNLI